MKNDYKVLEPIGKIESLTERYIEAEQFIMNLNWFERMFCSRKIRKFLKSRLTKYSY